MQGVKNNISFRNGIRVKSRKYVGPGCSPAPSDVKDNLPVMLVISLFILLVILFKCKYHLQVDYITQYACDFSGVHINCFYTYLSLITASYFFRQVLQKPLKFVNNVLQTKERFLNESNFRSFLSLCTFILGNRLRKRSNNFCVNISIFSYFVRNGTAKI